jgi:hypothetical protein
MDDLNAGIKIKKKFIKPVTTAQHPPTPPEMKFRRKFVSDIFSS